MKEQRVWHARWKGRHRSAGALRSGILVQVCLTPDYTEARVVWAVSVEGAWLGLINVPYKFYHSVWHITECVPL